MDWNDLAKTLAPTVVGFGLGAWNTHAVQRRGDAKAARSALYGQGQELAAALAAFRVERNVHKAKHWTKRRVFQAAGMSFMSWATAFWETPATDPVLDRAVRSAPGALQTMAAWRDKADLEERRVIDALYHLFAVVLPLAGSSHKPVAEAAQRFAEAVNKMEPDDVVDGLLADVVTAIRRATAKPLRWWQWRKKRRQKHLAAS